LLRHQIPSFLEPNFSGDFGDFASIVAHMKKIADSNQFFSELPYDVLAIGNHKLYIYANALDMHQNFAPKFPGRYLSSNVDTTILSPNGSPVSVPVGSRFAKFKMRKGCRVTSLGVLYNFTETITIKGGRHAWVSRPILGSQGLALTSAQFADTIKDEPDFFLLVGYPASHGSWPYARGT
ncbi:hypothetical protein EDB85DRAFT_1872183, partial [Lactarius pseudohatsudake]